MENVADRKESTHNAILKAALSQFSKKGYRDATIREISELAGCNTLTIFRHFESKEKLLYSVVERYRSLAVSARELEISIDHERLRQSVTELSALYFKVLFRNIDIVRIFISDCAGLPAIRENAWIICPALREHMSQSLLRAGLPSSPEVTEMFVAYITKLCLELINHENIRTYGEKAKRSFLEKMEPQIAFICDIISKD